MQELRLCLGEKITPVLTNFTQPLVVMVETFRMSECGQKQDQVPGQDEYVRALQGQLPVQVPDPGKLKPVLLPRS